MQKRWMLCVVTVLICLSLAGCTFHNETLDAQAELCLQAINHDDEAALYAMLYPGTVTEEEFSKVFAQYRASLSKADLNTLKLIQYRYNIINTVRSYHGIYRFLADGNEYLLNITYLADSTGKGLTQLYISSAADAVVKKAPLSERLKDPGFVIGTVYQLICWSLIIVTIVDIVRHRPRRYGWYIALSLFFFNISIQTYTFSIPLGIILYWALRKGLLEAKRKNEAQSAVSANPDPDSETESCVNTNPR